MQQAREFIWIPLTDSMSMCTAWYGWDQVREYIRNQEKHHTVTPFIDEYQNLMKKMRLEGRN
jgi:hypothetical protein